MTVAIRSDELEAKELPPEDWIIDGWLTRQNVGFMIGEAKWGKSWLMMAAAIDLAEGKPVWGTSNLKPTRPLRTVYFTQEDTEHNAQDRLRAHKRHGGRTLGDKFWLVPKDLDLTLDGAHGQITRIIEAVEKAAGKIDLVVFDPMRKIHSGEENDSQTIGNLWRQVDKIMKRFDCSTIIVHHVRKPPQIREGYDPTDMYNGRGSGDIYGGGDAFVMAVQAGIAPDGKEWKNTDLHFITKRGEGLPAIRVRTTFKTGQVTLIGSAPQPL